MTDYSKLVEALRSHLLSVPLSMLNEAAAAIEELENALADECKECDYLVDENSRLTTENNKLQAEVERLQVDVEVAYALMEVQDGE